MTTTSGQGFSFDSVMSPIGKSKLEVQGQGMRYRFDAFPAAAFPAKFSGLGEGTVTEMKAEVEVAVSRFKQQGGAGTESRSTRTTSRRTRPTWSSPASGFAPTASAFPSGCSLGASLGEREGRACHGRTGDEHRGQDGRHRHAAAPRPA